MPTSARGMREQQRVTRRVAHDCRIRAGRLGLGGNRIVTDRARSELDAIPHQHNCTRVPPISMHGFGVGGGQWGGARSDRLAVPFADAMLVVLPDAIGARHVELADARPWVRAHASGRNATLHIGRTHARAVIPGVLELMADGRLHPEQVTGNVADLDDAPRALSEHVRTHATKTILAQVRLMSDPGDPQPEALEARHRGRAELTRATSP